MAALVWAACHFCGVNPKDTVQRNATRIETIAEAGVSESRLVICHDGLVKWHLDHQSCPKVQSPSMSNSAVTLAPNALIVVICNSTDGPEA